MNHETNTGLPIIQSLWIGGSLSIMEQLCIKSFLSNGHVFHLYVYDYVSNVPEGTVIKDASEMIPPDKIFKYKDRDSYAGFSNIFRYKLILEKGNYWVDTDMICLSPFDFLSDYIFACATDKVQKWSLKKNTGVENCIFKAPPNSEIMEYCLYESSIRDPQDLKWGEIGPDLLGAAVKKFDLDKYVADYNTFCPIPTHEWYRIIDNSLLVSMIETARMTIFRTKALHLWNEMWRLNGIDKNSDFYKRSIYERLKNRYL